MVVDGDARVRNLERRALTYEIILHVNDDEGGALRIEVKHV